MTGMAERTEHRHHGIDQVELTVTDLAESKRFHADAFGWEFDHAKPAASAQR